MRRLLVWGSVLSLFFAGVLSGAGAVEKSLIRVKIMIQADEEIQAAVENLLRKELRALGDISLVNEKPDFEILVMAISSGTAAVPREITGVAFSTVFLRPFNRSGIPEYFSSRSAAEKPSGAIPEKFEQSRIYRDHFLQVGTPKEMGEICKDIAAYFRKMILEDERPPSLMRK